MKYKLYVPAQSRFSSTHITINSCVLPLKYQMVENDKSKVVDHKIYGFFKL